MEPQFFNYGGEIRLQNTIVDNVFTSFIGNLYSIHLIYDKNNIRIINEIENEQYGKAAIANINFGGQITNNVFVTPLAYYSYNQNKIDGELIYVCFIEKEQYMQVVFKGSFRERLFLENSNYKDLLRNPPLPASKPGDYLGNWWQKIQ